MSIRDLQTTLHEHAAAIHDDALLGRAAAARNRAQSIRRRRRSVVAAVAVAAVVVPVVGAQLLGSNPLDRSAPVIKPPEPAPTVEAAFAGRTLLDSEVVVDGSELTLTYNSDTPTQVSASCYGVGNAYTVHMTLDGRGPGATPCESAKPPEPLMGYVVDRRFRPGPHTLRIWLTTRTGSETVVRVPGSVLTGAVYHLPDPVAVVAGVDIYDLERAFDDVWQYVGSKESARGERRIVATRESDGQLLAQLVVTGVPAEKIRLLVDGIESSASAALDGSGYLQLPAGSHTVELLTTVEAGQHAQLGVVWRTIAP